MTKKISKKVREEAALMCQMWASSEPYAMGSAAHSIGVETTSPSWRLAMDVGTHVARLHAWIGADDWRAYHAECESLLRTGWAPAIDSLHHELSNP